MARRKKRLGHFCWCCGRVRANERFLSHAGKRVRCYAEQVAAQDTRARQAFRHEWEEYLTYDSEPEERTD